MEIIKLDPRQKKTASNVLAAAFFNYPMFTLYFPNYKTRAKSLAWYLGKVLNCAMRFGEVHVTTDISGIIFTLPPGHTKLSTWELLCNGFLFTPFVMGFGHYIRSMECEAFVANAHEKIMADRPHYYLWGIVVDPGKQKKGVGSALMSPLLLKADAEKKPIYLETHDENNVKYYQAMGFELAHKDSISKYNMEIWCMVREPV